MDSTRTTATDELADNAGSADDTGLPEAGVTPGTLFDDHKAPGAFRTIGEVARALGIRQHVLRYWEEQFPMLTPVKRSGNRRYYRPEDVVLIETIDRLVHREGYTLRGARLALEPLHKKPKRATGAVPKEPEPVETASAEPAAPPADTPWLDELRAIRETLAAALAD